MYTNAMGWMWAAIIISLILLWGAITSLAWADSNEFDPDSFCARADSAIASMKTSDRQEEPQGSWTEHVEEEIGVRFRYPSGWGELQVGTNDGFGNRTLARRFSLLGGPEFNSPGLGGEFVLLNGRVTADWVTLGGFYSEIIMEAVPEEVKDKIVEVLPPIDQNNLCVALGDGLKIDLSAADLPPMTEAQAATLPQMHSFDNDSPEVILCRAVGETIVFYKTCQLRGGRKYIAGAMRFDLPGFDSCQLVARGFEPMAPEFLVEIAKIILSVTPIESDREKSQSNK
jgi:hypothetical protein